MNLRALISSDLDEKLKCFICKNYVSYFPIFLCSNNLNLCGRCTLPEAITSYHNEACEAICQSVKFPCRYMSGGCIEELVPAEVPQHEKTCPFRIVKCMVTRPKSCNWSGFLPILLEHCQKKHSGQLLKDGEFELDLACSKEIDYLVEYNNDVIVFTKKYNCDSKKLICAVYSNQYRLVGEASCQIGLKYGKMTILYEIDIMGVKEVTYAEFYVNFCKTNNYNIAVGKISIDSTQINDIRDQTEFEEKNTEILPLLKCEYCGKQLKPPLYRDSELKTFCNKCNDYVSTKKDNTLNHLVRAFVKYPCQNRDKGCTHSAEYNLIKKHHLFCQNSNITCAVDSRCSWTGLRKDVSEHVLNDHPDCIISLDNKIELPSRNETVNKFVKLYNFLFRLCYCKTSSDGFKVAVQMMGNYKEKFKYQIDVSNNEHDGRISLWDFCTKLTDNKDEFTDSKRYCYFYKDQLDSFNLSENNKNPNIKFTVRIFK